jgi:Amt family ammonium transporter
MTLTEAEINATIALATELAGAATAKQAADTMFILFCGFLVFFMHAGFAMLETGSVRNMNKVNILFKNIGTVTIGSLCYFVIGYGLAYGSDASNDFIGSNSFAGSSLYNEEYEKTLLDFQEADPALAEYEGGAVGRSIYTGNAHRTFFFQFAFCVTAATIVSGAVAGRIKLEAYFFIAAYMTTFVYPVVTYWVWSSEGWLSAFTSGEKLFNTCGLIDYAGSGVVHMTGGVAALIAAFILGPRAGRFGEEAKAMPGHNLAMAALGTLILWFGWYGFNCGSALAFDGTNVAKVAVTTSLSPAAACLTAIIYSKATTGTYDLPMALNAILGGLVSITAGCSTVEDWSAIVIGVIGAFVYIFAANALVKYEIDDPIGASPVHGACGAWGVIAVGIFGNGRDVLTAYSGCPENFVSDNSQYWQPLPGSQMAVQIIGVLAITAWVLATFAPVVFIMKKINFLRVDPDMELAGLDQSEHLASAPVESEVKAGSPSNIEDEL